MCGRVFPIMGQKNAEMVTGVEADDAASCPYKARCVFQGSNITTGDGRPAHEIFQEVGATPSNMCNARTANAAAALKKRSRTVAMPNKLTFRVASIRRDVLRRT